MLIGVARVSTQGQDHALQMDALKAAGCERIFCETISGMKKDRPQLQAALEFAREGDAIVVYSLSRLGRSLKHLIQVGEELQKRGVGLLRATDRVTSRPAGNDKARHRGR